MRIAAFLEAKGMSAGPLPTCGLGNIDADPAFVDVVSGDVRLSERSPCVEAGTKDLPGLILIDMVIGKWRAMEKRQI